MHIRDIFAATPTTFSFEFFPPKTPETAERLYESITELEALKPAFVSVTYGAGGGTRELTHELVARVKKTTNLDPIPHLTCVCHQEDDIRQILERYASEGISNILALGGDPPRDKADWDRSQDHFRYASDLVAFIRKFNDDGTHADPRGFGIGVAGFPEGHPGTPNRLEEMDHLKAKVDAGADYICTQLFFDNRDFYDFRERCELAGIDVPIIAGIMPITSAKGMRRMGDLAAGSRFPAPLLRAINRATATDDEAEAAEAVKRVGVHWATEQCRDLIDNQVRGIHLYTLNKSDATRQIYQNLGVRDSEALAQR
ncbi:MAG: methylenetetrahydrofolate reductase [NAD(P)H] [Phycisphaeraceae bacterium]